MWEHSSPLCAQTVCGVGPGVVVVDDVAEDQVSILKKPRVCERRQ